MTKKDNSGRRTTVVLDAEDMQAMHVVMKRWAQNNMSTALRWCLRTVAAAEKFTVRSMPDADDSSPPVQTNDDPHAC